MGLTAAVIISLIGAGVSAAGQVEQGRQQKVAVDAEAQLRETESIQEETRFRKEVIKLQKRQRLAYAKNGVDLSGQTPVLLFNETATQVELDALSIRESGKAEANVLRQGGHIRSSAANTGAASTMLSALGSAYANKGSH